MIDIQDYLIAIGFFLNGVFIPFLFGLALLFFLFNIARYFILGGNNEESRAKAKTSALYGISAFIFLVIFWGIVNLFVTAFEIDDDFPITPDYILDNSYN